MGSSSSKFRKHLQNGDEVAALNVYNSHSDLRKGLDPNSSYGDNYQHETPLHYAARHGMKSLLRIFLFEHGGNPNKTNCHKETALHCACMEKNAQYYPVQRRRLDCLNLILQWRGAQLKDGEVEKVDLAALDEDNNTALHYAAHSGLKACVEQLVNHASPLYVENKENKTPCDCAEFSRFSDIALYLESKMVFSNDGNVDEIEDLPPEVDSEEYSGLRAQDLQEAKDQLLVETADMLSIPLFTAEALLRNHEWSREMLLDAWMTNPVACCQKSGVTTPASLFSEIPILAESLSTPTMPHPSTAFAECEICTQSFRMADEPVHMGCHQFCRKCWERYLNVKIQEGGVHDITCPGYGCNILVPVEVIENVVSRDMARRYLQFDIKAFVDSNPNIKWCPHPGCGWAIRLPEVLQGSSVIGITSPRHSKLQSDMSRAVECGNGHQFCWECNGDAHEPCSCQSLQKWFGEISTIKPETLSGTEQNMETAANCLWLVTNSKLCPNCKSPIQKNEGCNHMKCSKCKHDFCWVCLDQWKRHNSNTGGYFKCNRYEVSKKVEDMSKNAIAEAAVKNIKMQELKKFVHYYTRYKNHENSYKLEEPLLKTAKVKMLKLAEAVTDLATAKDETKFVEEAVHKLLCARRVLKYSYVYGYYLDGPLYRKIVFEFMQTELEECTEILSQMVNRLYLRTSRKKIIEQSQICHRKRLEFITAIAKGLVPPETPPNLRKKKRKYSMDAEDEDIRKAIVASIEDFDPDNPWILDASGRHTNIAALLDWPSDDSDDDSDIVPSRSSISYVPTPSVATPEHCIRDSCTRPCVKNPRTGEYHNFCSLRCSRLHKQRKQEPVQDFTEIQLDEQMDFVRALEMSRIQYLKEQSVLQTVETPVDAADHMRESLENCTPVERLDIEIKRLLKLSSLETDDLEETERKYLDSGLLDEEKSATLSSRFGDNQSTIVSRVPNKSVEDLYHPDCTSCQGAGLSPSKHPHSQGSLGQCKLDLENSLFDDISLETLGACGGKLQTRTDEDIAGGTNIDDIRIEGPIMQKLLNMDRIDNPDVNIQKSQIGTGFGVIKDISVSNILVQEDDKTKHFSKKDMSGLTKNKSKVLERSNGRLFSANTPGEDENVFVLISPESDFSESSCSEVWGYRPKILSELAQKNETEIESSVDICLYTDLPNQNNCYKHDECTSKASPNVVSEPKIMNLSGKWIQEMPQLNLPGKQNQEMPQLKLTEDLREITIDKPKQKVVAAYSEKAQSETCTQDVNDTDPSAEKSALRGMDDLLRLPTISLSPEPNNTIMQSLSVDGENLNLLAIIDGTKKILSVETVTRPTVSGFTHNDSQLEEIVSQNNFKSTYV